MGDAVPAAIADALRSIPWGEVVTYGELAALAGRPRAPRAAGTFCAENNFPLVVPCHRVVSSSGLGGYGSLGVRLQAPAARAGGRRPVRLSEDVRAELAADRAAEAVLPARRAVALVRGAGSVHLRGGGRIGVHLELASGAVARRAFSLLRSYGVACEIRTYKRRAFERGTRYQIHLEDDARALQVLNEAGILDARLAPLERAAAAGRRPRRAAAPPTCAGRSSPPARSSGPRNAHLELRAADTEAAALARRAGGAARASRSASTSARATRSPTRRALRRSRELLAFLGAHDVGAARCGEEAVVSATRARANRLANADHANIVRTSRAADAQLRAIRRLEREGRLDELAPELREVARLRVRHPTLSLRELAAPLQPARDEGGGAPPPGQAPAPGRALRKKRRERAGGEAPRTTSPSALATLRTVTPDGV